MQFEVEVEIAATPEKVWAALINVVRWSEWTASVTKVELQGGEHLALGSKVRIKQPHMPDLVWTITEFDPEHSFSWQNTNTGVTTIGSHMIKASTNNRVVATFGISQSGILAPVIGILSSARTKRYVNMEALGLKRHCESDLENVADEEKP